MPGASQAAIHEKTVDQWGSIVGADRADGKEIIAAADEERRFIRDMAKQHVGFGNGRDVHAVMKIRTT
jgi:hypothetical protein